MADKTNQQEHEEEMAKIESRKIAWQKSRFWFCFWEVIQVLFWLSFFAILAQCDCKCLIK